MWWLSNAYTIKFWGILVWFWWFFKQEKSFKNQNSYKQTGKQADKQVKGKEKEKKIKKYEGKGKKLADG